MAKTIIKVRFLVLIYVLLCILTVLFSRNFFIDTLQDGNVPGLLTVVVFFTIPAVLLVVLGVSLFSLVADFIFRRPGSKFNARLLVYFTVIVIFSITPITLMTSISLNEAVRFWHSLDASASARAANSFAAENYSLHLERFENILKQNDFTRITPGSRLPQNIASVQLFLNKWQEFPISAESWPSTFFSGDEQFKLDYPPSLEQGFLPRELPRDAGTIRYVLKQSASAIYLISYNLGSEFDRDRAATENMSRQFNTINHLRQNMQPLLLFYYIVFFLPTLLMTIIIAISFTRRITRPIVELTEATRKVAEGDFSIQILSRRNDELGLLIRSFNAMVQDLEKTRIALVKNEKVSIWQNMAQQLAHEIKNPLTPIKLSAERLLRRWQNDPANIGEILESSMMAIIQETESLTTLLNEFRTLSKPMEPSQVWTKLKEPLEEVINSYSTSYPSVIFDTSYVNKEISVKIEKNRLSQILTNIIINATDAMNKQGRIDIRTDLVKKRDTSYCRISIKDSGKGIKEEERHRVFTPYYTTKESGTGLGLPIIERIINDHGGAIWFDSAQGMGTTFYIDLPGKIDGEDK